MFLERRPTNGIWYYKKVTMVEGRRKVLRKSLGTHCKKEAQLKAMQIYFSIESDASIESNNARKAGSVLDDGFVVTNEQQTKPVSSVVPESTPGIQTATIEQPEAVEVQKEPESGILFADVVQILEIPSFF